MLLLPKVEFHEMKTRMAGRRESFFFLYFFLVLFFWGALCLVFLFSTASSLYLTKFLASLKNLLSFFSLSRQAEETESNMRFVLVSSSPAWPASAQDTAAAPWGEGPYLRLLA